MSSAKTFRGVSPSDVSMFDELLLTSTVASWSLCLLHSIVGGVSFVDFSLLLLESNTDD